MPSSETRAFAHSLPGESLDRWELLGDHHAVVAALAAEFAGVFGFGEMARLAGALHDIGKLSPEFQAYICGERSSGADHSSAGACIALETYPSTAGKILAAIIVAHHAGLADYADLARRLEREKLRIPRSWRAFHGPLPAPASLNPTTAFRLKEGPQGFSSSFLIRMLFSALVDADFLSTEAFYFAARGESVPRGGHRSIIDLRDRLRAHMIDMRRRARPSELNSLRAHILDHAIDKADRAPGLFTLTVPTGGGKTLASLSFALEHAARHGLRRVIYVIPYTGARIETLARLPPRRSRSCRSLAGARIETPAAR